MTWCGRGNRGQMPPLRGRSRARLRMPPYMDSIDEQPLLLTLEEVGHHLRLGYRTIKHLVAEGHVPTVKVGGSVRVRRADLVAYINGLAPRECSRRDGGAA